MAHAEIERMRVAANTALLVIDVQRAIDDPVWSKEGPRNNPDAERNIARLLEHWRAMTRPIFHIRHDSVKAGSPYRPDRPGNAFKAEARPLDGEPIIPKTTNNAFIGTGLEQRLRGAGIDALVIAGVITNNSIEATQWPATLVSTRTSLKTPPSHSPGAITEGFFGAPTKCMRCRSPTWTANTAKSC